jgi:hypothetical protein
MRRVRSSENLRQLLPGSVNLNRPLQGQKQRLIHNVADTVASWGAASSAPTIE